MNVLLLAGLGIFLGVFGGKIFQKFKIPQVVGYILIGVAMGGSISGIMKPEMLDSFTPLINFTLGIIGFLIGAELKGEVFRKHGKSIYFILVSEGMLAFLMVCAGVTLFTHKLSLGLLFGAIASATDPASTVNVLWEYKSRGPLTTTLTSIVALDDGLALILYGLVSVFSHAMIAHESFSLLHSLFYPLLELVKSIALGAVAGFILVNLMKFFSKDAMIPLSIGAVGIIVGLSVLWELDLILTAMVMGAFISNIVPKMADELFEKIQGLTAPLYIFFFVYVGANLDIHVFLKLTMLSIVVIYLISRSAGKIFGAMFGAVIAKAKKTVSRYCGICLFTQGGVAIGLAMSISHNLGNIGPEGKEVGATIISVVAATTFVVQLIGPIFVKLGITKADEAWRNVTEEDVIASSQVKDFMTTDFSCVKENAHLEKIMAVIKEQESYHFPVVNENDELTGLISLGELRNVFGEAQLEDVILAKDVAMPVEKLLYQSQSLKEAFEIFSKRQAEYLPVVENQNSKKVVGIIEHNPLIEMVSRKTLERQESLDKQAPQPA